MKRFTPLFILGFILFPMLHSSCIFPFAEVRGNYHVISDTLSINDYESIELNVSAEIVYRQMPQSEPFLQVSTDENILPSLSIDVEGKRLVIRSQNDAVLKPSRLIIYTNSKNLNEIAIHGSGDICLQNEMNAKKLNIRIAGSGDLKADSLFCETLKLQISGSGGISLAGAATTANFQISGSGDIAASNFLVQDVDCQISGSGDATVHAIRKLNASVSGSGSVRYLGNPTSVNTSVSGSGKIQKISQ